jgi:hypothetical protein
MQNGRSRSGPVRRLVSSWACAVIEWAEWRIFGPGLEMVAVLAEKEGRGFFDNIWGCAFTGHDFAFFGGSNHQQEMIRLMRLRFCNGQEE